MAEIPYGGATPAPERGAHGAGRIQTLGTFTNWAGAVVSLSLIVGIAVWGYKMLARDVSGVPVVRAASGAPMRVAPEDPGGRPAMHQGLAVNRVAAEGAAEKPADRLILAPAPVSLDDEDQPGAMIRMAGSGQTTAQSEEAVKRAKTSEAPQMGSIRALADKLSTGAAPLDEVSADPQTTPETVQTVAAAVPPVPATNPEGIEKAVAAAIKPDVKGGIKSSLRPVLRPGGLRKVAAPAAAALDVDPAGIPAGTKLAQLGAFDSPETARAEWGKLNARFEDYMEGKQRVIQKAKSGGRVFYRLRAMGFADLSDARRFCSALVAERADCIPVTSK